MPAPSTPYDYDAIIIGGGPAGLNAALVLGRCRRRTLLFDSGEYRNAVSRALHGYLTRDGCDPAYLRQLGRDELTQYDSLVLRDARVVAVEALPFGFAVVAEGGERFRCRKLLLATGVVDELPDVPGLVERYGTSVHHCPYCDAWEVRDQPLAVWGRGQDGKGFALEMTAWSRDLILCTDGPADFDERDRRRLALHGVRVREERIVRLEGPDGRLEWIVFDAGPPEQRVALFFSTGQRHRSDFARQLGSTFAPEGCVATDEHEATNVPGLYVAGDASRREQYVVVSAGEGALAAIAINTALIKDDLAAEEAQGHGPA